MIRARPFVVAELNVVIGGGTHNIKHLPTPNAALEAD